MSFNWRKKLKSFNFYIYFLAASLAVCDSQTKNPSVELAPGFSLSAAVTCRLDEFNDAAYTALPTLRTMAGQLTYRRPGVHYRYVYIYIYI